MYEAYFGLKRPPFKITPDTSLFYEGGKRGDILGALVYAINRGEGIVKVVGEVGSGKTMLCRMLQVKLPSSIEIIYIGNPSVSSEDILYVIAHELGLETAKDASKHVVMHALQDYLLARHMENKQVVLFIEEAQGMPIDTLEEIRLLSNLETDQNKLLQIVLFGQPELDQNLSHQSIRQLRERITHSFNLSPLTPDEIHKYLNFRMREVGYSGPELIRSEIAQKIEKHSGGLLRRINIIADKVLLSAYSESTHDLSTRHVTAAVNDSNFGEESGVKSRRFHWSLVWVLALVLFVGAGFIAVFQFSPEWITGPDRISAMRINSMAETPVSTTIVETVKSEPDGLQEADAPSDAALLARILDEVPSVAAEELPTAEVETLAEVSIPEPQAGESIDLTMPEVIAEQANEVTVEAVVEAPALNADYLSWLNNKVEDSKTWLANNTNQDGVSIQVLMRLKSAQRELVNYLQNEWPLDLGKTFVYEVELDNRRIYRVFYSEFNTVTEGHRQIQLLPKSIKVNSPYLHSLSRMKKALL